MSIQRPMLCPSAVGIRFKFFDVQTLSRHTFVIKIIVSYKVTADFNRKLIQERETYLVRIRRRLGNLFPRLILLDIVPGHDVYEKVELVKFRYRHRNIVSLRGKGFR